MTISSSAEEKYEEFLTRYGHCSNRITDKLIASYIGITPEFFSKLKNRKLSHSSDGSSAA